MKKLIVSLLLSGCASFNQAQVAHPRDAALFVGTALTMALIIGALAGNHTTATRTVYVYN